MVGRAIPLNAEEKIRFTPVRTEYYAVGVASSHRPAWPNSAAEADQFGVIPTTGRT
jgi:hypothetical protein